MIDFSKYHTKFLLKALQEFRVYKTATKMGYEITEGSSADFRSGFDQDKNFIVYLDDGTSVTENELKNELMFREHVPNKLESKIIRQQKAKTQKNR